MLLTRIVELGEENLDNSPGHRGCNRNKPASSTRESSMGDEACEKPPRADCLEVATAYYNASTVLLQAQMLPTRIVELGKEVLDNSQGNWAETK